MTVTAAQITYLAETADKVNARALTYCADHPDQAPVRQALLHVEKHAHGRGWDAEPFLFYLTRNARTGRMNYRSLDAFNQALRLLGDRPPQALEAFALGIEDVRAHIHASELPRTGLPPWLGQVTRSLWPTADGDLLPGGGPHQAFHGIGFLSEAWTVPYDQEAPAYNKATEALVHENRLYTHADRVEMREIHYVARDGNLWEVTRYRRTPDITIPRFCGLLYGASGTVPHALSRLCNAIASNPVPILPDGQWRSENTI